MRIVKNYIQGLKAAYLENNGRESWAHFENIKHGASNESIASLKKEFPFVPESLIEMLVYVDGTYWRAYAEEEIAFYFLGSDLEEYPYYLLSTKQIIENKNIAAESYSEYIIRKYDYVEIDERITSRIRNVSWLHFSDCMNNGGSSSLFIDFTPSDKGKKGQIIRFLHDPDEFIVIADSFDDYLKQLIDTDYNFIFEE